MEHSVAAEQHLVEQYLLNEMPPELREEFEEHFFDCQECAAEVRSTAAFLDAARTELNKPEFAGNVQPHRVEVAPIKQRGWSFWQPTLAFALAATLIFAIYQNAFVYPQLRSDLARLEAPEILPTVSLVSGNSRGGGIPSATVIDARSLLLLVDIPAQERFLNYTCLLYSPQHDLVWTGRILAQEAKDTVSIRIPIGKRAAGTYSLLVKGNEAASSAGVDLANYSFSLNAGSVGSAQ